MVNWSENLHMRINGIERLIYSTNNQVELCLTTIENQLDAIQQKLEEKAYSKGESNTKGSVHSKRESCVLKRRKLSYTLTHTFGHIA